MNKFRYKLYEFMQGRRGLDQFGHFLIIASAVLFLISVFFLTRITYSLGIALLIYGNFRAFSKNLYKREQENNWYLRQKYAFTGGRTFGGTRGPRYDMLHYRYFKCPCCGQKMRAPKGKGNIKVKCHNCQTEFTKKV